jgi:hypothetical protein
MVPYRGEIMVLDGAWVCFGAVDLSLGLLADGFDVSLVTDHLEDAIRLHDAIGAIPWSVRARLALARACAPESPTRTHQLLDEAKALCAGTQLSRLAGEAEHLRSLTTP